MSATLTFNSGDPATSESKLKELILYISKRCDCDPNFGSVMLNKILFFSDFQSFAKTGRPITGVEYFKLPQGPAPRRMKPIQDGLVSSGELGIALRDRHGLTQKRPTALREPNLALFTAEEIAMVDGVIAELDGYTAKSVSDLSHRTRAWTVVGERESIPYQYALLSSRPLGDFEITQSQKLNAIYGWENTN